MRDPFDDLPPWTAAIAWRLTFFARGQHAARRRRRHLRWTLRALRPALARPDAAEKLAVAFCQASLDLAELAVARRVNLATFRPTFGRLCALARAELAHDRDDRLLLAALQNLEASAEPVPWAVAQVPARAVFLAALAGPLPEEAAEAAAMLVNDLSVIGSELPSAALAAVAGMHLRS